MASLLSTLFSSRDSYLTNHISKINCDNSFPVHYKLKYDELIHGMGDKSLLVSGGTDEERTILLMSVIRSITSKIIVLHNGNRFLKADSMKKCGIQAEEWDGNIYKGMNKAQIISLLAGEKTDDELLFFYAYAFEVCEVLEVPVSVEGINSIDWLGVKWQQDLLMNVSQRDRALDLLSRFDRQMAEKAVKGMCRVERLSRSMLSNHGKGLTDILDKETVLTKEVYGSNSYITRQCIEAIQALAESGVQLTLILDDVYLPDSPLIKDNFRNVRLILAADDITQFDSGMHLTNRKCNVVVFNHTSFGSAKVISEAYFGEYDKLVNDITSGQNKSFLAATTYNSSMTVRHGRELRLKPEYIVNLPMGVAFVHLVNGLEGVVCLR